MSNSCFSKDSSPYSVFTLRSCAAVVLAEAVTRTFPKAQLVSCGATDLGFACDFVVDEDLDAAALRLIEEQMQQRIVEEPAVSSAEMVGENAANYFQHHKQKLRSVIVAEDHNEELIDLWRIGEFMELCPQPHVASLKSLRAFSLEELFVQNLTLPNGEPLRVTRISGVIAPNRQALKQLLRKRKGAAARAHQRLGRDAELFGWHPAAETAGWLWYPRGTILREILLRWWEQEVLALGAEKVHTPEDLPSRALHALIYQATEANPPVFYAEIRSQLNEEEEHDTCGLLRARRVTSDECTWIGPQDQTHEALVKLLNLLNRSCQLYPETTRLVFPVREGEQCKQADWKIGVQLLKGALDDSSWELPWEEDPGFQSELPALYCLQQDALGREWPIARLEIDPALPRKLELYPHSPPIMWAQAAALLNLERTIALLLEQNAGLLPLWLAPEQVRLLTVGAGANNYARAIHEDWRQKKLRTGLDCSDKKLADKVFDAEKCKVPYVIVIGEKEQQSERVTLRTPSQTTKGQTLSPQEIVAQLHEEIDSSSMLPK